jgi:hypothetical protein
MYLAIKGTRDDIKLLENARTDGSISERVRQGLLDVLRERVKGNFIIPDYGHCFAGSEYVIVPSVANTGPQGVYAYHILRKAGDIGIGKQRTDETGLMYLEFPEELVKMVITFDEDGYPVSSVDLAKYGLSMPVIKINPHGSGTLDKYVAIFPHETEVSAETTEVKAPEVKTTTASKAKRPRPSVNETTSSLPANRSWLYIVILTAITLAVGWFLFKRRK